jgi:hypothetical protein
MAGTLWAAFNGVTEWQDHRKSRQNADQRLVSSWFGGVESGVSPFILIHRFELWIGMEGGVNRGLNPIFQGRSVFPFGCMA